MAAFVVDVAACCCPLCGTRVLSVGNSGRVVAAAQHAVPLHRNRDSGEAFMLCDDCGILADLPVDLTLN
jgi:hypothetical protein